MKLRCYCLLVIVGLLVCFIYCVLVFVGFVGSGWWLVNIIYKILIGCMCVVNEMIVVVGVF